MPALAPLVLASSLFLLAVDAGTQVPDGGRPADAGDTAGVEDPDAPTVGAALDRLEATIGDRLTLTVTATSRPGLILTLPQRLELGPFEVLDREDPPRGGRDLDSARRLHRFVLGVAAYESGALTLPALELSYLTSTGEIRAVRTQPLQVTIRSLLATSDLGADAALQQIRAPREAWVEDRRVRRALEIGALVLGGVMAALFLWRVVARLRRRRGGTEAARSSAPRRPPEEVAIERLERLRAAGDFERDGYRPFYFELAEILREYLGGRYGFDSLELTTTELVAELAARAPEVARSDGEIVRFLEESDLVKFAKSGSSLDRAHGAIALVQAFVLSSSSPLEAAVEEAAGPAVEPKGGA